MITFNILLLSLRSLQFSYNYHSQLQRLFMPRVLDKVKWEVEEEDASILILPENGSTGLDLSFSTHIFLLEKIKDPALVSFIFYTVSIP